MNYREGQYFVVHNDRMLGLFGSLGTAKAVRTKEFKGRGSIHVIDMTRCGPTVGLAAPPEVNSVLVGETIEEVREFKINNPEYGGWIEMSVRMTNAMRGRRIDDYVLLSGFYRATSRQQEALLATLIPATVK